MCNTESENRFCFHYCHFKYSEVHFTKVPVYTFHVTIRLSLELVRHCHRGESSHLLLVIRGAHRLLSSRKYSTHQVLWLHLLMVSVDYSKIMKIRLISNGLLTELSAWSLLKEDLWMGSVWGKNRADGTTWHQRQESVVVTLQHVMWPAQDAATSMQNEGCDHLLIEQHYSLSKYSVPGTVSDLRQMAVNKTVV